MRPVLGNWGQAQAFSCRRVDPVAEPDVTDPEAEPGQQKSIIAWIVVQLFDEFDSSVDRFDDDPFVVGAAERLAFDDLAGDAVAHEPGMGSSIGRRQPTRSSINSLLRIPDDAESTMIAAVRTIPTTATACDRCSGRLQGRVAPSAVGACSASRANTFSTPTAATALVSGPRSRGNQRESILRRPACLARIPVATGSSRSSADHPAASRLVISWSSCRGSGVPVLV